MDEQTVIDGSGVASTALTFVPDPLKIRGVSPCPAASTRRAPLLTKVNFRFVLLSNSSLLDLVLPDS